MACGLDGCVRLVELVGVEVCRGAELVSFEAVGLAGSKRFNVTCYVKESPAQFPLRGRFSVHWRRRQNLLCITGWIPNGEAGERQQELESHCAGVRHHAKIKTRAPKP